MLPKYLYYLIGLHEIKLTVLTLLSCYPPIHSTNTFSSIAELPLSTLADNAASAWRNLGYLNSKNIFKSVLLAFEWSNRPNKFVAECSDIMKI